MKNYFTIFLFVLSVLTPEKINPQSRSDLDLVLVYPELTKKVLHNTDSKFGPTDTWELFLMSNHFKYRMLADKDLDDINDQDDVVIIPSLEAVTEEMIEDIEKISSEGKGILLTGNFAEFDAEGNRTSDFQRRILDFNIMAMPAISAVSINHTLKGNTPFSLNLKPGYKILLSKNPELYYGSGISDSCIPAGSYFPADETFPDSLSGIISEFRSPGRLLWFGFGIDQLIGNERYEFLSDSFNWLASKAVVFVNSLPANYKSAGIIYKNIENPIDFKEFSSLPQRMNLLALPNIFEKSGNEIKNLNDSSNIVIIWDDFFFSNMLLPQKIDWLNKTKLLIGGITNQKYYGISSYSRLNDSNEVKSLNKAGYAFVFSPGYSDAFEIDFDSTENFYYFINASIPGLNYNSELNFIISNNGIFYLNADSLLSRENFKQYLNIPDIWITTFSDLLNWGLKRNYVKTSLEFINDEYKIKVNNTGSSDIEDVGIWLSMPDINGNLHVKNPDNPVQLTFDNDKKMYYMKITILKSNQTMVFEISGMNE